jgi:hypothetical protein
MSEYAIIHLGIFFFKKEKKNHFGIFLILERNEMSEYWKNKSM